MDGARKFQVGTAEAGTEADKMTKVRRKVIDSVDWAAVKARDLRRTCIHEYAHEVVARHFGAPSYVTITANPHGSIEDKFYSGQCAICAKLATQQIRLVCLAGIIAEHIDSDRLADADDLADWFMGGKLTLSDTDAVGAGAYKLRDVKRCVSLVKELWPEIESAVRIAVETEEAIEEAAEAAEMNTAA